MHESVFPSKEQKVRNIVTPPLLVALVLEAGLHMYHIHTDQYQHYFGDGILLLSTSLPVVICISSFFIEWFERYRSRDLLEYISQEENPQISTQEEPYFGTTEKLNIDSIYYERRPPQE